VPIGGDGGGSGHPGYRQAPLLRRIKGRMKKEGREVRRKEEERKVGDVLMPNGLALLVGGEDGASSIKEKKKDQTQWEWIIYKELELNLFVVKH
jgi:hypothetical protein